jgi:beta-1,4-mannosyl-glycoprotein beta-1,4-N-acetylglucosaminyltransferase
VPGTCFHCSSCFDLLAAVRVKISSFPHTELDHARFHDQKHIIDRYQKGKDLFDRSDALFGRAVLNETELPRLLKLERKHFSYLLIRSSSPNAGFRDAQTENNTKSSK